MAKYYITDGENEKVVEVKPENGKHFSYQELKEFVDGMVEIVPLPSGKSLVGNEEAKLIPLPKNKLASAEWCKEYPIEQYPHNNDQTICGNALIVNESELEQ